MGSQINSPYVSGLIYLTSGTFDINDTANAGEVDIPAGFNRIKIIYIASAKAGNPLNLSLNAGTEADDQVEICHEYEWEVDDGTYLGEINILTNEGFSFLLTKGNPTAKTGVTISGYLNGLGLTIEKIFFQTADHKQFYIDYVVYGLK